MITRLRTFLTSWRRSLLVLVGCLAYIALVQAAVRVFPQVAPSLGHMWLIIYVLYLIAANAAALIWAYLVGDMVAATLTPVFTRAFPETPWAERSDKAKEKYADSLLSVSNTVASATLIAVLVVPFTALVQAMVGRRDVGALLSPLLTPGGLPGWQAVLFMVLFFLPIVFIQWARKNALDIYDQVARPTPPAPSPGPNGATAATDACPVSADPPPPSGERR